MKTATLSRYFGLRFLWVVIAIFAGLLALVAMVDFVEMLRRSSGIEDASALFVAKITLGEAQERLSWLTKLDTGSLKVKIMGSIVIISAIDLLEQFFSVEPVPTEKLIWLLGIHLTFVVTAVLLALVDRLSQARNQAFHRL